MQLVFKNQRQAATRPGRPEHALWHVQLPLETRRDGPALGRLVLRQVRRPGDAKAVQGAEGCRHALRVVRIALCEGYRPAGGGLALRLVRLE